MTASAPSIAEVAQRFEHLFDLLRSPRFLHPGTANPDIPLYLQPYDIRRQASVDLALTALIQRLQTHGISVLHADLLHLVRSLLEPRGRLAELLLQEPSMPRKKVIEIMARHAHVGDRILPALRDRFEVGPWQIALLSGCGSVYPFLRTHTLLENLPNIMDRRPVVVFYPGEYTYRPAGGSELRLFGCLENTGHYRALNLDHIRLSS